MRPARAWAPPLIPALSLTLALSLGGCGTSRQYKRLPPEEKAFFSAVDVFLDEAQIDAYLSTEDPDARRSLAEKMALTPKWDALTPEQKQAIAEARVLEGMSKDAVVMAWGLPNRIRKQPANSGDWVEVYQYRFERTKKGEVFPSPPDSRTAYKNEVFERHVEFLDGRVQAIKEVAGAAGQE